MAFPKAQGSRSLVQVVPRFTPPELQDAANQRMKGLLAEAYEETKAILVRNRAALDALSEALMKDNTIDGETVREIVERLGCQTDLDRRKAERAMFL